MMRIDFDKLRAGLRRALSPRVALAVGVVVGGAAGLWALESHSSSIPTPSQGACCVSSVTVGDTMMIPAVGADKDFFEVPSSPPSVMFLMGNNETMQFFPDDQFLPEAFTPGFYPASSATANGRRGFIGAKEGDFVNTGCTDPALVAKMSWFDKSNTDPALNGSIIYDKDSDFAAPFFEPDKFYHTLGNRVAVLGGLTGGDYPFSLDGADDYTYFRNLSPTSTTLGACYETVGWNTTDYYSASTELMDECQACLGSVGWWRGPLITGTTTGGFQGGEYPPARLTQITGQAPPPLEANRKWVLNGRMLNLRPPKFVVARKVLKDVINMAPNVRMGVASFGKDHGWYDPPFVIEGMRPSCDKSFPAINEAALNRPKLMSAVNSVWFGHNERAVGESLFGLGGYFSSQLRDNKWSNWFTNPINPGAFGWPGCCDGGTYDEPPGTPGHTGFDYAVRSPDEWIKPNEVVGGKYLPGQPWEDYDYNNRVVCFACQVNSVIVLTDGTPKYDNSVPITKMMQLLTAKGARHPDGTLLTFDFTDPEHNLASGGVNYCDQFEKSPGVKFTKADCDYGNESYNWPTGLATGNKNFMDDVAFFLANMDLRDDLPGNQTIRTYTIGYGDNSAMLQSIALAGKGKFYRANNSTELRNSIIDALGDIRQLSTSFASASVSGVQTGGQSSTYVPRFVPRQGRPYEGHLFRFFYYSEFAQGCQPERAKSTAGDPYDLNHDKDCDDTFYVDKPSGFVSGVPDITTFSSNNIVQENTDGTWVKVATATPLDGGRIEGGLPAEPFWDLGDTVGKRKAALPCDLNDPLGANKGRCIFTMIDRDNDGKFTDLDNPPVEFHESNLAQLQPYLLSAGDAFCSTLYAKQKKAWKGDPTQQTDCALQLIRFVRGMDVFDYDGDSNYDEERPCKDATSPTDSCKLADIFHSTPVTVDPPIEPFLCSLGLSSQCMSTLYDDFSISVTADPLCSSGSGVKPCYRPTLDPLRSSTNRYGAYDVYRHATPGRDRVLLIGSNGGMLHVVHAGSPTSRPKSGVLDDTYDIGTGQEMWAFIPPDLLPKLGLMVGEHEYFVDGTPMVRDIWADGAPLGTLTDRKKDGTKDAQEFRSIAIITERGGGQRYTALDLTDPYAIFKAVKGDASVKPFRWMFPNACQPESLSMGQSWSNFAPKPPPIGPVRLAPSAVSAAQDTDRGYEERWVAVLNGGYSSDLSRGRGLYMVDAWTGEELWAAEAKPGFRSGDPYDDLLNQMGPVVASPSLVDIGKAESVQRDMDGYFDTLVVGDMLGQGWTFRFREPGQLDTTTGLVNNWFGSRSLEMARQDGTSAGPANLFEKQPIFHIAANVLQPETGWLRSFMGTGDRQHLRAVTGQDCSADDLLACIRLKCNVKATLTGEVNGQKRTSVIEYVGGVLQGNSEAWTATTGLACTGSRMDLTELKLSCPDAALGSAVFPPTSTGTSERVYNAQSWCAASGGNWTCDHLNLNTSEHHDQLLSSTELTTVPANRFFGYHSYGGTKRIFKDKAGAVAFDGLRVSDKPGLSCAGGVPCSLVDVTIPDALYNYLPPDSMGVKQRYISVGDLSKLTAAKTEDPGWFVRYNNSPLERSASGSTVLAGVVFWSTFAPSSGSGASVCSLSGLGDLSYSWQADVITGLPDQASSFQVRNSSGAVIGYIDAKPHGTSAPPGEPAPIVSLSKTGGIRYEVSMSSPGAAPSTETLASQANVTPDISWSEVPRNLHECRHVNAQACK